MEDKVKVVVLSSGGLDSMLAAKLMEKYGFSVHAVNFYTGFCIVEQRRRVDGSRSASSKKTLVNPALKSAAEIEIPVEIIDISKEYLEMVTNPKHGYGANVNPCIDCRIYMLKRAHEFMKKIGAKFLVTGEVVGQRPMSQFKNTMRLIEKEAGVDGLIVRPLSGKLLDATIAEKEGIIKREWLYDISGRGRNRQVALAQELNISDFPNPAGGCCFLTDQTYARRFFDLMGHRTVKSLTMEDVVRLRLGRQFRWSEEFKLTIGRNETENRLLEEYAENDMAVIKSTVEMGPVALIEGKFSDSDIMKCAALNASYGKGRAKENVEFSLKLNGSEKIINVKPLNFEDFKQYLITHDNPANS